MIKLPTLKEMLEVRMHFGHKKERSHPRSKEYVFALRDKIFVIDLEKTRQKLKKALEFIKDSAAKGKIILFVGTKRQARNPVKNAAQKCNMPFVDFRWLGGTLTNFETIKKSIKKLEDLEKKTTTDEFLKLTKKEKLLVEREIEKLNKTHSGIRNLIRIPDIIYIVDSNEESTVVAESRMMGISTVGICDTTADPRLIDWPIPANDDSEHSIKLITDLVADAINEGIGEIKEDKSKKDKTNDGIDNKEKK